MVKIHPWQSYDELLKETWKKKKNKLLMLLFPGAPPDGAAAIQSRPTGRHNHHQRALCVRGLELLNWMCQMSSKLIILLSNNNL